MFSNKPSSFYIYKIKSEKYWNMINEIPQLCKTYERLNKLSEPEDDFEKNRYHSDLEVTLKKINNTREELKTLSEELENANGELEKKIEKLEYRYDLIVKSYRYLFSISFTTGFSIILIYCLRFKKN